MSKFVCSKFKLFFDSFMKIFTNEDIRAIDRQTIDTENVTSLELIQRVASGVACEIVARWNPSKKLTIFAGPGNNGADALATARLLVEQGFAPTVYLFNIGGDRLSHDCRDCRDELLAAVHGIDFTEVTGRFTTPELNSQHLVIDGLFGSGLREPLSGGFKSLVQYVNESKATIVSIDVPSGMFGDWNSQAINRNIIHANLTLAIQFPRLAFFIADNADLVGEWKVIEIGLSYDAIRQTPSDFHLVEGKEVKKLLKKRQPFASKADFGSALLVAGSYGMMGAAVLSARGASRAGAGKITVHSPQCGFEIMQSSVPEVMFDADRHKLILSDIHPEHDYSAIGIGPGIGTNEQTVDALDHFFKVYDKPLIIDADALNCMALRPSMLNHLPVLSVLTPHAGEFDRLFDVQPSAEARLRKAIEISHYQNLLILLKGRHTALVRPDGKVYFNSTGTPAMATAGSGDVLTGVITSFMAQGFRPEVSALIGAYVHGLAGEIAAEKHGEYGVTAGDIAANIGIAIKRIMTL